MSVIDGPPAVQRCYQSLVYQSCSQKVTLPEASTILAEQDVVPEETQGSHVRAVRVLQILQSPIVAQLRSTIVPIWA